MCDQFEDSNDTEKEKILHELQNMDFEDMFTNFSSLPTFNFNVKGEEMCDIWADKPIRRCLGREFKHAAEETSFIGKLSFVDTEMKSNRVLFTNAPVQSNFSPTKK